MLDGARCCPKYICWFLTGGIPSNHYDSCSDVRLKSRERSDYQVSILEVAGSAATADEILKMEMRWKAKLQTREMGLNGN